VLQDHERPVSVSAADDGEIELPLVEDRLAHIASRPGLRTMSMRSWLSESIIS
jgi:hypothetical protein